MKPSGSPERISTPSTSSSSTPVVTDDPARAAVVAPPLAREAAARGPWPAPRREPLTLWVTIAAVLLLAYFFANVEIQIEGAAGWATSLPTWRIEHSWVLDLLWGGRPMTGYHAWVFPCVALFFHFPFAFTLRWSWRAEARALACIMLFWITEDLLWFVLNPAFGLARFRPRYVPWHIHWLGPAPTDYWTFFVVAVLLFWWSCGGRETN